MAVSWGPNTVHPIPGASPAPGVAAPAATTTAAPAAPAVGGTGFNFGTPAAATAPTAAAAAPASPGLFGGGGAAAAPAPGAAKTGLFGSAPAPATTGGLFGSSAPVPAPASGSLFGTTTTPAPAAGGSLFGTTAAPAPGGSLFGGGSAFGSPAPTFGAAAAPATGGGLFGGFSAAPPAAATAAPAQPQIPAQAALQAGLDASARQEEAKVVDAMQTIHKAYTGTQAADGGSSSSSSSAPFTCVTYNPLTPQLRQQTWLNGVGVDDQPHPVIPLPRPPQISQRDWDSAIVQNPDWQQYMPAPLVGAETLQARLTYQQELSTQLDQQVKQVKAAQETVRKRSQDVQRQLQEAVRTQSRQKKHLLFVMRRVELARAFNLPLQKGEVEAIEKVSQVLQQMKRLEHQLGQIVSKHGGLDGGSSSSALVTAAQRPPQQRPIQIQVVGVPEDDTRLREILSRHRSELAQITSKVQKDQRDLTLVQQRVKAIQHNSTPTIRLPGTR